MSSFLRPSGWVVLVGLALGGCAGAPSRAPAADASTSAPPSSIVSASPPSPEEPWEKIRDEDGITVFRREVPGSPLVAFRGEGDIDAGIATVALVQMDLDHSPEWIDSLAEAKVLERRSDTQFLTYSHIKAPLMVSDRDFVNRIDIEFGAPDHITFHMQSVVDPLGPVTGYVRGQLMQSSFALTAVGPERTHLACEIHADPKGALPTWVVNLFQKSWAFKTISHLRAQVKKADVVSRAPLVREILARQGFSL